MFSAFVNKDFLLSFSAVILYGNSGSCSNSIMTGISSSAFCSSIPLKLGIDDGYPFYYSPTFYENRAIEYSLEGDEPFFLPLSNGLYFKGSEANGIAVIKNCSSRHIALMADKEFVGYFEKTSLKDPYTVKNLYYSFIIIRGTLQEALELANFVNIRPYVTLNITSG